jgi:hypothetical protein
MTDITYLSIQLFTIISLTLVDALTAITQHPEWFH